MRVLPSCVHVESKKAVCKITNLAKVNAIVSNVGSKRTDMYFLGQMLQQTGPNKLGETVSDRCCISWKCVDAPVPVTTTKAPQECDKVWRRKIYGGSQTTVAPDNNEHDTDIHEDDTDIPLRKATFGGGY